MVKIVITLEDMEPEGEQVKVNFNIECLAEEDDLNKTVTPAMLMGFEYQRQFADGEINLPVIKERLIAMHNKKMLIEQAVESTLPKVS